MITVVGGPSCSLWQAPELGKSIEKMGHSSSSVPNIGPHSVESSKLIKYMAFVTKVMIIMSLHVPYFPCGVTVCLCLE